MASIDEPESSDEDASPDCGRREATVEHLDRPCRIIQSHNERTFNGHRLCVHVMRIGLMVYAWAACDSDNFGSLHACFPPSQQAR
jgi:hypothetical protein